ncbi:hypothetical protein CDFC105_93930 [Clostridioides difficile]|nr:hypothetical protein CDFC105_93930 [Clostridioides difficile]
MYNLLVVDDDVDILNINQIYFSNIGFNVYTSETAKAVSYTHLTLPTKRIV